MTPRADSHTSEEVIEEVLRIAKNQEESYEGIHKNIPLNVASSLERPYRRLFLDYEEIAKKAHEFFMGYATRNPTILTPDAQKAIENLAIARNYKFYVVELNVPKTEGVWRHITDIDVVSFHKINDTIGILEELLRKPIGLEHFSKPHRKGNIENRYWSSHSVTKRKHPQKVEITDIKVRKRVNGTGYSIPDEQVEYLAKEFPHILGAFAH